MTTSIKHYPDTLAETFRRMRNNYLRETRKLMHGLSAVGDWIPLVNISETETAYFIRAEIPDVSQECVLVTVQNGTISLQGERKLSDGERCYKFHCIERSYGKFSRCFQMPDDADPVVFKTEFKDGMINILLPKIRRQANETDLAAEV